MPTSDTNDKKPKGCVGSVIKILLIILLIVPAITLVYIGKALGFVVKIFRRGKDLFAPLATIGAIILSIVNFLPTPVARHVDEGAETLGVTANKLDKIPSGRTTGSTEALGKIAMDSNIIHDIPLDIVAHHIHEESQQGWHAIKIAEKNIVEIIEQGARLSNNTTRFLEPIKVKTLAIVPDNVDAYRNVFKASADEISFDEVASELRESVYKFSILDNAEVLSSVNVGESEFLQSIMKHSDSNTLVIIGHNEELAAGKHLILPDGSEVSVDKIYETCEEAKVQCLVLTCYSDDFNIQRQVSLDEAYEMTQTGLDVVKQVRAQQALLPGLTNGEITETDLFVATIRYHRTAKNLAKVSITGATTAAVRGTYLATSKLLSHDETDASSMDQASRD